MGESLPLGEVELMETWYLSHTAFVLGLKSLPLGEVELMETAVLVGGVNPRSRFP